MLSKFGAMLFLTLLTGFSCTAKSEIVLFSESFETDGNGSRYTASTPFNDGSSDHWNRTDGSDISNTSGPYSAFDGAYFWAAEDTDDNGGNGNDLQTIDFNGIDVTGYTDLTFSGLFGAGNENGLGASAYDAGDQFFVEYRLDGGSYQKGLQFSYEANGDPFNEPLRQDTNFDGVGDGVQLLTSLEEFTFGISNLSNATTLDLRISVSMNSGNEEIAFDNVRVSAVPEPTSAMLFGTVLVGFAYRRRRG